jgi:hypothetical protein
MQTITYANSRSRKAGTYYENKVAKLLDTLRVTYTRQPRLNGGYADFLVHIPHILIECKTTFTPQALEQLSRYAHGLPRPLALVCICKYYHSVPVQIQQVAAIGGAPKLRTIDDLLQATPGAFTIIPWTGRFA